MQENVPWGEILEAFYLSKSWWIYSRLLPTESEVCITDQLGHRECVSTGAEGTRTCRSLGHHLLHSLILRLLVLCAPADFESQSSLLQNRLHPQIQIPNACPGSRRHHFQVIFQVCEFNISSKLHFFPKGARNFCIRKHYLQT